MKRGLTPVDFRAFKKQVSFIHTIQEKPDLGRYVRELHWTVLNTNSNDWRWRLEDEFRRGWEVVDTISQTTRWYDNQDDEEGCYEPEDGTLIPLQFTLTPSNIMPEPLWRAFRSMVNIVSVDMCWLRY